MLLHVSAETRSHHQGKYTKFVVSCEYITWSQVEIKCTFQSKLLYICMLCAIKYEVSKIKLYITRLIRSNYFTCIFFPSKEIYEMLGYAIYFRVLCNFVLEYIFLYIRDQHIRIKSGKR